MTATRQEANILAHRRSWRTPNLLTVHNCADNIERTLQRDEHTTWGFVIYRCTYEDDREWEKLVKILVHEARETLRKANGLDVWKRTRVTIFEDKAQLNGASKHKVRESFREWTATAPLREQGTYQGQSPRYGFCIHVDEAALKSIADDRAAGGTSSNTACSKPGYVNLIQGDWISNASERMGAGEEVVDGSTLKDLGWMQVWYAQALAAYYELLGDRDMWTREYRRPPRIAYW